MKKYKYYVAYGSNLNKRQMMMRCPGAKAVGTGFIRGYELLFKGSKTGAYLTIEKKRGGRVPIAIWKVTKENEEALDRYEGYPTFYYKADLKIKLDEKEIDAFVYKKNVRINNLLFLHFRAIYTLTKKRKDRRKPKG